MTTYFFDLNEAESCNPDSEGRRFDTADDALEHARRALRFFVGQQALEGVIPVTSNIVVRTETGMHRVVSFSEALHVA
jgi:hypothetical protein